MNDISKNPPENRPNTVVQGISLTLKPELVPRFFGFLRHGVALDVQVECSVEDVLCAGFGINPQYVEERIQTLFLDGKPVDDIKTAVVRDGSVMAISAAMPGLAGATLRKGGFFSGMRSQISCKSANASGSGERGTVTLKIFNLLVKELGPGFLESGVWIDGNEIRDFLVLQDNDFWTGCETLIFKGREVDPKSLAGVTWPHEKMLLKVRSQS